jgi:soluble lytic murein transglycosylase-like protein
MRKVIIGLTLIFSSLIYSAQPLEAASTQRCPQYEQLLVTLAPKGGWDVKKMSHIMWRESRCKAVIRSKTADSGLLQINDINHKFLTGKLGYKINKTILMDPIVNIKAAAQLCLFAKKAWHNCYSPWGK